MAWVGGVGGWCGWAVWAVWAVWMGGAAQCGVAWYNVSRGGTAHNLPCERAQLVVPVGDRRVDHVL